jgi:hypothetical protein
MNLHVFASGILFYLFSSLFFFLEDNKGNLQSYEFIVFCFTPCLRIFHSHGHVTIAFTIKAYK